jgi:hypothetical protein
LEYYATFREGHHYPIVRVTFRRGDFKHRQETKTGEVCRSSASALRRTGELNRGQ